MRDEVAWTVEHHGVFQMVYYAEHYGWDPEQRQAFRDHPFYQSCVDFCERWDQSSFDPDYPMHDLDFFAPMVREVFARKAHDQAHVLPGVVVGFRAARPTPSTALPLRPFGLRRICLACFRSATPLPRYASVSRSLSQATA